MIFRARMHGKEEHPGTSLADADGIAPSTDGTQFIRDGLLCILHVVESDTHTAFAVDRSVAKGSDGTGFQVEAHQCDPLILVRGHGHVSKSHPECGAIEQQTLWRGTFS